MHTSFKTEYGNIAVEYPIGGTHVNRILNLKDCLYDGTEASDGYHTFGELYEHRIRLFLTLCRYVQKEDESARSYGGVTRPERVWRSFCHSDGSSFKGWFIMGINVEKGEQITYHIPVSYWEETNWAETLDLAPEWDFHTPEDVIERLKHL